MSKKYIPQKAYSINDIEYYILDEDDGNGRICSKAVQRTLLEIELLYYRDSRLLELSNDEIRDIVKLFK